jgi:hypothetical protein
MFHPMGSPIVYLIIMKWLRTPYVKKLAKIYNGDVHA